MGYRTITREDVLLLKHKKKKKLNKLLIAVCMFLIICIAAVSGIVIRGASSKSETELVKGRQMQPVACADIGVSNIETKEIYDRYFEQTTTEEAVEEASEAENDEYMSGNDIYDKDMYVKAKGAVKEDYFDNTIFIGDSRTEGLILYSGVPNIKGFCYKGLSVDKLKTEKKITIPGYSGRYSCYEAIENTSYDNYYCMFGVNELGWVYTDVFIKEFNELLDFIREKNPDAMIYVESILPVTRASSERGDIYRQEKIDEYNEMLIEMCKNRKDVIYLDIAASVLGDDGYLPEEATTDGVHCNSEYCKKIIEYILNNTYEIKK